MTLTNNQVTALLLGHQRLVNQMLEQLKAPTLEDANAGDTLKDGSIVVTKTGKWALLMAPRETQVSVPWSERFSEVFEALELNGFNPSQWFIPRSRDLRIAYEAIHKELYPGRYWTSSHLSPSTALFMGIESTGDLVMDCSSKENVYNCRAFRCTSY